MIINQNLSAINYTRSAAPKAAAAAAPAEAAGPSESSSFTQLPARIASLNPTAVAAVAKEFQGHEFVDGELLVKVKPGMDFSLMGDFASEYGATVVEKFNIPQNIYKAFDGDLLRLKLPAGITLAEAVTAMRADDRVAYAEPNDVIRLDPQEGQQPPSQNPPQQPPAQPGVPNDLNSQLWGLNNTGQTGGTSGADIHALDAWKVTTGDRTNGPLIAVIDTGADYNHPDLAANIWTNPGEIP
ncbi:MAG: hypothetical protein KC910_05585, partial [Candidatus Eremiobacteraeota bacterium]|nr:hypothetical protein [Candidatus Eremiobacteraeota bacterium]